MVPMERKVSSICVSGRFLPGGIFLWIQGETFLQNEKLKHFHEDVQKLVTDGLWKQITFKKTENYIFESAGFLYAMEKL